MSTLLYIFHAHQGGGGLSIMKTILRKTAKKQFKLKYRNQSKEQTLV